MECMDLATLLAAEESDILDLFVEVGRMEELVEAFAYAGKSLLLLTSAKSSSSRTKKIRSKGWTQELWSVK
jgi:nuclear pore complex protein Nup107